MIEWRRSVTNVGEVVVRSCDLEEKESLNAWIEEDKAGVVGQRRTGARVWADKVKRTFRS